MPAPSSLEPPVLTTARLTLRGQGAADFADSAAMWADPDVTRYISPRPFTEEESWSRLLRNRGLWSVLGYGYWVARDTTSDRFIGEVGFADFHREIEPSIVGVPEVGWVLAAAAHGQGLASEAVAAVLAWGDARWPGGRTVCLIDPDNAPSLAVARRAGFSEVARTTYKDGPVVLLGR